MPINIATVYISGRSDEKEVELEVLDHLLEICSSCQEEQLIILEDFNIETWNPISSRDKNWVGLLETFQMHELKIPGNYSFIRRENKTIKRTRPDHIFVSKHIRIIRETMFPPLSKNDHIPFYIDLEIESNPSWKPTISLNSKNKIIELLNNSKFTSFEELSNVLSNKIDKYGKFGDRLGIQNIRSSLKNEIDELEKSLLEIIESDETNKNKIEEIQYELKESYLQQKKLRKN